MRTKSIQEVADLVVEMELGYTSNTLTGKEDNFDELFHDYDVLWAMACDVIDTMYKDMTKKEAVKAIDRIYNSVHLCWLAQGLC